MVPPIEVIVQRAILNHQFENGFMISCNYQEGRNNFQNDLLTFAGSTENEILDFYDKNNVMTNDMSRFYCLCGCPGRQMCKPAYDRGFVNKEFFEGYFEVKKGVVIRAVFDDSEKGYSFYKLQ